MAKVSTMDKVLYALLILGGLYSLYLWLVSLVSLCAGVELTSWLLPYNVFWYVVAGGCLYLAILIAAVIYRFCFADGDINQARANKWILYSFFGLFNYIVFFVLTLTFEQYYNLVADNDTLVNRSSVPFGSEFQTVPTVVLNAPSINAALSVVNSNFKLAVVAPSAEALANWFSVLAIIFFGTTLIFFSFLMMISSPWNNKADAIEAAVAETFKGEKTNKGLKNRLF